MEKETKTSKKRISIGLILLAIIFVAFTIGFVHATISKPSPSSFLMGQSPTVGAFYAINPQSSSIVYADNADRYFAVYPEYQSSVLLPYASKSTEGNYTQWSEEGAINSEGIVSGSHIGEYPSSAHMAMIYSNESDCVYVAFARTVTVTRSYLIRGNISDAGVLTWGTRGQLDIDGEIYGGHYDIAIDKSGYPMVLISASNSTAGKWMSSVFFMNTTTEPFDYQCDIAFVDSLPDEERFSSIIPLNETSACYIIEGDSVNLNPLYGGYMNNSQTDWGSFSNITNNNIKLWNDDNSVNLMDWSATYDTRYAYVCYVDVDYDLYYFTIDLNDFSKSNEVLIYNGTTALHPFQPAITVNDYTPSIFYWEKQQTPSTMYGLAIELNELDVWTIDNPVNVTSRPWETTNYVLSGICRETGNQTAIMGYYSGNGAFSGSDYNFVGYGFEEEEAKVPSVFHTHWLFFIGIFGVILMVVAPSWFAFKIRKEGLKGETLERGFWALMMFIVGYCMLLCWLGAFN